MKKTSTSKFFGITKTLMLLLLTAGLTPLYAKSMISQQDLKARVEKYCNMYMQERVYMHFDNTSYRCGDRIWYKAYIVRGDNFKAAERSRYLTVELLNSLGLPVKTQIVPVADGQASGSFLLDKSITAGFYEVRAYTPWMLNFTPGDGHAWKKFNRKAYHRELPARFFHYLEGNAGIFSRVFPVYEVDSMGNRLIKKAPAGVKQDDALEVSFYPEGGNLIEDVPSKVAFQIKNLNGQYVNTDVSIIIDGKTVCNTTPPHEGRGSIVLSGNDVKRDKDVWLVAKGKKYLLPRPLRRGYALRVDSKGQNRSVVIERNRNTKGQLLTMLVTCRQKTGKVSAIDLKTGTSHSETLPDSILSTGVNIITLLAENGNIIAQREIFVKNGPVAYVLRKKQDTTEDRALSFTLKNSKGNTVNRKAGISLSVREESGKEKTFYSDNILTYMLLSSEIKGFVPNASYYFESEDSAHAADLDLLLMVQGWTRYDFEQMTGARPFVQDVASFDGFSFGGKVYNTNGRTDFKSWNIYKKQYWLYGQLKLNNGQTLESECKLDKGQFKLSFPDFTGCGKLTMVINDHSVAGTGEGNKSIAGHVTIKRVPSCYVDKAIVTSSPFSPIGKQWTWYETYTDNAVSVDSGAFSMNIYRDQLETYLQNAYGTLMTDGQMFQEFSSVYYNRTLLELLGIDGRSTYRDGNGRAFNMWDQSLAFPGGQYRPPGLMCSYINLVVPRHYQRNMHNAAKYNEMVDGNDLLCKYDKNRDYNDVHGIVEARLNYHYYPSEQRYKDLWSRYDRPTSGDRVPFYLFQTLINGITPQVEFFTEDYSRKPLPDTVESRCGRTVYWNPDVQTGEDGDIRIELPVALTPDMVISAEGVADDGIFIINGK